MAKYVDVEALYCADCEYYGNCDHVTCDVKSFPEADVVEVVRCRDCALRGDWQCPMYWEEYVEWDDDGYHEVDYVVHDATGDDGYCDYGVRRDNDG